MVPSRRRFGATVAQSGWAMAPELFTLQPKRFTTSSGTRLASR